MNKESLKKLEETFETLLNSWGSDTPPEAIWTANNFLEFMILYWELEWNMDEKYFKEEEDEEGENDAIVQELIGKISLK